MIKIIGIMLSAWFGIVFLFISCFCLVKKYEMKTYKKILLNKINASPEKILGRRVLLSGILFSLQDIQQDPSILDHLTWEDVDLINFIKLFQPRDNSSDKRFLRKVFDLPEEALQRKFILKKKLYSLKKIREDWQRIFKDLDLDDWVAIFNNPGLTQARVNPR